MMTSSFKSTPFLKKKSPEKILGERLIASCSRACKLEEQVARCREQIREQKIELLSLAAENEMLKRKLQALSPATSPVPSPKEPEKVHNPFLFEDIFDNDDELRLISDANNCWNINDKMARE